MTRSEWRSADMEALRQSHGGKCSDCGAKDSGRKYGELQPLEFSHREPTGLCGRGRGMRVRYFDIKAHPECYTLRCARCHRKYDREYWRRKAASA